MTTWALEKRPKSCGTAGRHNGTSAPDPSCARQLVETSGPQTRARVTRDSWSNLRALGSGPQSPGTVVRHRGPMDLIANRQGQMVDTKAFGLRPSRQGQLVDPVGHWARPRVAQEPWCSRWALSPGPDSPKISDRPRGYSDNCTSRPGQLCHPMRPWARARVTRETWSNPQIIGSGPQSPKTSGRPRGPTVASASHPGTFVDTAAPPSGPEARGTPG